MPLAARNGSGVVALAEQMSAPAIKTPTSPNVRRETSMMLFFKSDSARRFEECVVQPNRSPAGAILRRRSEDYQHAQGIGNGSAGDGQLLPLVRNKVGHFVRL